MDGYLSKPLQLQDLRDALAEVLDRAPSDGEPGAAYPSLAELCAGDPANVAQLLRIFVTATREDLKAMDGAAEAGDQVRLRQLAHRLCSACQQLDEAKAVGAMRAVESLDPAEGVDPDAAAAGLYAAARSELVAVLARAEAFIQRQAAP
jgi:HPt (histidine-containing phosphotransfer) domain-containing protein